MRIISFLLACLALCVAHASGEEAENALDGTLVTCGTEKVAILEGTESKDGHFALAWTLRPKPKKSSVNWSAYDPKNPEAFLTKFVSDTDNEFPPDGDYLLVNGVVNLPARSFTPLPGKSPYYPGEPRCDLRVAWSEDRQGDRYAAVSNVVGSNHSENSVDLRLVGVNSGGVSFVDLKPDADKAVRNYMHKRDPKDYQRYDWSFDFTDSAKGNQPFHVFEGDSLTVHFIAEIVSAATNLDAGRVIFALPKGTVTGTATGK